MTQNSTFNVKLFNSQLKQIKTRHEKWFSNNSKSLDK